MKKELARDLVHILPQSFDVINEFIKYRIDVLHIQMETAEDKRVIELQGAIEELRRLLKLRDNAVAVLGGPNG